MAGSLISTRFLVISDTHGFEFEGATGPFRQPVAKTDVLIHCGDMTMIGGAASYKKSLEMLGSIEAELKLVIAGNHDLDLDKTYFDSHFDEEIDDAEDHHDAMNVMKGTLAKDAGITYLEEGIYKFTLSSSGATFTVYASPYTPEFQDYAFPYERDQDRYNTSDQVAEGMTSIAANPIPSSGVDIVITHGPPKLILDRCPTGDVGCENLLRAISRARPLMHCFGHIHEGYGAKVITWKEDGLGADAIENHGALQKNLYPEANKVPPERGRHTLMVNAALMDGNYKADNAPWLIDLNLQQGRISQLDQFSHWK